MSFSASVMIAIKNQCLMVSSRHGMRRTWRECWYPLGLRSYPWVRTYLIFPFQSEAQMQVSKVEGSRNSLYFMLGITVSKMALMVKVDFSSSRARTTKVARNVFVLYVSSGVRWRVRWLEWCGSHAKLGGDLGCRWSFSKFLIHHKACMDDHII